MGYLIDNVRPIYCKNDNAEYTLGRHSVEYTPQNLYDCTVNSPSRTIVSLYQLVMPWKLDMMRIPPVGADRC